MNTHVGPVLKAALGVSLGIGDIVAVMNFDGRPCDQNTEDIACDLCILGAGIAGLNALFAASRYLSRNQKVVLVDRNAAAGGMWLATYDYVRLHQPHPMFTAGDIRWTLGENASYLATRSEVVAHFSHCLATLRKRLSLEERLGYEYQSHDDTGAGPDDVLIRCNSTTAGRPGLRIRAKKLVKAFGVNVKPKAPLELSSEQVRSVSPDLHDLVGEEIKASAAPVYIIGGGKTAMDTAYSLLQRFPSKRVSLVIGSGTMFGAREKLFPTGLSRMWSGYTPLQMFGDLAQRFDGRNERDVLDRLRARYTVALVPDARRFMFGTLSQQENSVIAERSHEIIKDYFVDVVDRAGAPRLRLQSGETREIEAGSWIVNCTGYMQLDQEPYEPFVSENGRVVTVNARSAINALTSSSAYLAVHLSYLNKLRELPLYEVDYGALHRANRDVFSVVVGSHSLYNGWLTMRSLSRKAVAEFGTDTDRWFPLPRRMYDGVGFLLQQMRNPDHMRRALDTVRERFGVRCGPLEQTAKGVPCSSRG